MVELTLNDRRLDAAIEEAFDASIAPGRRSTRPCRTSRPRSGLPNLCDVQAVGEVAGALAVQLQHNFKGALGFERKLRGREQTGETLGFAVMRFICSSRVSTGDWESRVVCGIKSTNPCG